MRAAIFAALTSLVLWSAPAAAHVSLLESEPADGAVLAAAPSVMVLQFADVVAPMSAQIVGVGVRSPLTMRGKEDTVQLDLPSGLAPGPYVVSWKVGSLDDHPVSGSLMFVVGPATAKRAATGMVRAQAAEKNRVVRFEISPGIAGQNAIVARIGLPKPPQEVVIELSHKEAGIEPLRRMMQRRDGAYVLEGPELLIPGVWSVSLEVLINDFDKSFFDVDIPIR